MSLLSQRTIEYHARCNLLRHRLGNKCSHCPNHLSLQFDIIRPVGGSHHTYGSMRRIRFYEAQHALGNVQLLCVRCHVTKSIADRRAARAGVPALTPGVADISHPPPILI